MTAERLLIRGGTVIDGSGGEPRVADVLLADGILAAVGPDATASDAGQPAVTPLDATGLLCDSSFPTFLLSYWGRDRSKGERLTVPSIVKSLTSDVAKAVGLNDRGLLRPGYKADLNVIDFDAITLHLPRVRHDLPSGGRRITQAADGYRATIVSGVVTYRDGRPTGALPGRLVRGPRQLPVSRRTRSPA